jgi:hypothetical protein
MQSRAGDHQAACNQKVGPFPTVAEAADSRRFETDECKVFSIDNSLFPEARNPALTANG